MQTDLIFDKMNGFLTEEIFPLKEMTEIEDEFSEEKECGRLYDEVYQAKQRICMRLGEDEDRDIENILNGMEKIARVLSMRMYEYGKRGNLETSKCNGYEKEISLCMSKQQ